MMSTAAVIGLTPGKRLLNSSFFHCSDPAEKFYYAGSEHGPPASSMRSFVIARSSLSSNYGNGYQPSKPSTHSVKALKDHVVDTASSLPSTASTWFEALNDFVEEENKEGGEGEESFDLDMEALLLLQKSLLEKQWNITFGDMDSLGKRRGVKKEVPVTSSGVSARERRVNRKKKGNVESKSAQGSNGTLETDIGFTPKLLHKRLGRGYMNGGVVSKEYLTHAEVLHLSNIIKAGLVLDERKSRLRERLGCDPTDEQLADSLTISRSELHSRQFAFSLAREKLAMSNVRLVMSIAQKYNRMGAKMGDLVQGVSKAFLENTSAFPLPNHLHGRLSLIRNARIRLEEKGIDPTIDKIAQMLNMSERKVRNATEADTKVISLDREAYPSVDGVPGASFHHYFADENVENNPWHRLYEWAVKDEVNKLIDSTLHAREQEIIRLYHGIGGKCLTWEDISKRIGLSRERVRQVGLVAFEKLKLAARTKKMDALLVKH
ncbi:RNA polymerase sigma factor sigA [Linum grandiflorum]